MKSKTNYLLNSNNKPKMKKLLEKMLPIYIPASRRFSPKLHLAIWNCGTRPQTLLQAFKDIRITIRKNHDPLIVIKKGDV